MNTLFEVRLKQLIRFNVILMYLSLGAAWPALAAPGVIWSEDFDNLPDGVTFHAGEAGWDGTVSGVGGYFKVNSLKYEGNNLDKEATWTSESINISYFTNVSIGIDLSAAGVLESDDYIKVYYVIDGGTRTLLQNGGSQSGSFSSLRATVAGLSGKSLKIIVSMYNTTDGEKYAFDNVSVTAEQGALPANTAWSETFNGVSDNGTSPKWSLNTSGTDMSSVGYFAIRQGKLLGRDLGGTAIWNSQDINIAAYSSVSISADFSGFGKLDSDEDFVKLYYKLNGGSEVLVGSLVGTPSVPVTISSGNLSGTTLKIIIKTFNDIDDERYTIDNILVKYSSALAITSMTGGTLTCTTPAVTLDVSTNASNATYVWSGPNGFSSTLKSPQVTVAGNYTVTASSGGASVSATTTVAQGNIEAPQLSVWSSGILTNLSTTSTIWATSSTANTTFTWTGFTAGQGTITTGNPGMYTVTARNTSNGCATTGSIKLLQVLNGIWYEDFDNLPDDVTYHAGQAGWDGQASGINGYFKVKNIKYEGNNLGKEVVWTSESINIAYFANVGIRADLASEGSLETADYIRVYYKLDDGPETLLQNGQQTGSFSPLTATASGLSGRKLKVIVRMSNSADDEKYAFDNVIVTGDPGTLPPNLVWKETFNTVPDQTTTSDQWTLDISNTTISNVGYFDVRQGSLMGRDLGGTAVWKSREINISSYGSVNVFADMSGFGALDSDEDFIKVYYKLNGGSEVLIGSLAGAPAAPVTVSASKLSGSKVQVIIKTFNDIDNERYNIDNIFVQYDQPLLTITSITGGTLTCTAPTVTLDVVTNVSDVTYLWTGPNGFSSTAQRPQVNVAGTYSVTVTRAGESATASATVSQGNVDAPQLRVWSSGILTRLSTSSELWATSSTSNTTFTWTGFAAGQSEITVSTPGVYTVTARNSANGCTTTRSLKLLDVPNTIWYEDFDNLPDELTYHAGQAGWDGETSGISGHFEIQDIRYEAKDLDKEVVWTTERIQLTHFTNIGIRVDLASEGTLETSDYMKVYYQLDDGPKTLLQNGEQYGLFNPVMATASGLSGQRLKLFVHVNNSASDEKYFFDNIIVYGDQIPLPADVIWDETFNNVPDFSKTSNKWTLDISNTDISNVGYFETRQGRLLGRDLGGQAVWKSAEINIASYPSVSISADLSGFGVLDSDEDYIKVYYKLDGGSEVLIGSIAGTPSIPVNVSVSGLTGNKVQVIVKTLNDIENERYTIDNILVRGAIPPVAITSITGGTLTCATPAVHVNVETNPGSVTYHWTGPGGFTSVLKNPEVTVAGMYSVTVSSGGQSATASVEVLQNTNLPAIAAASVGTFTCTTTSVTLTANSAVDGLILLWSGPAGFTSASKNPVVSVQGVYTVRGTNPANGCASTADVATQQDKAEPGVMASISGVLTCNASAATLSATSQTTGILYAWTGPGGYASSEQNSATTIPGIYQVTVKSFQNGCSSSSTVEVVQNNAIPAGVTASVSGEITCANNIVLLQGASATPGVGYQWSGPWGYASALQTPSVDVPGVYQLTVTNPANGCTARASATVVKSAAAARGCDEAP